MAAILPARSGFGPAARRVDDASGGAWRTAAEAGLLLAFFLALFALEAAVNRSAAPSVAACPAAESPPWDPPDGLSGDMEN
jgi:hypothetical protein